MSRLFLILVLLTSALTAQAFTAGTYQLTARGVTYPAYTDPNAMCSDNAFITMLTADSTWNNPSYRITGVIAASGDTTGIRCFGYTYGLTGTSYPTDFLTYPQGKYTVAFTAAPVAPAPAPVVTASSVPATSTTSSTSTTSTAVNVDVIALTAAIVSIEAAMTKIFTLPASADIAKVWFIGFGLPLTLYLVAWGFGVVVNSFRTRHDD